MNRPHRNALSLSHKVLRALVVLNAGAGALILALLVASLVAPGWVMTALGVAPPDATGPFVLGMRAIMVIGIFSAALTHLVLARLLDIVETVRDGDPFVAGNAARLQLIAWTVLGLEAFHIAIVSIAAAMATDTTPIDIRWRFSVARLVTVLLLFVLARVFEEGARMRADLEGTV